MSLRKFIDYDILFYPAEIDLDELVVLGEIYPHHNKTDPEKQKYYLAKILDSFLVAESNHIAKEGHGNNNMFPVCSRVLKQSGLREYNSYLDFMCGLGLLTGDDTYYNKRCKNYAFDFNRNGNEKKYYVYFKKRNGCRIRKKHKIIQKIYPHLYGDMKRLSINKEVVGNILCQLYTKDFTRHQQERNLHRIETFTTNTWKRGKTGRLYTGITNLKRELRRCLLLEGKELWELDIKSSIPVMLLNVLGGDKEYVSNILRRIDGEGIKLGLSKERKSLIMCPKKGLQDTSDYKKIKNLILNQNKDLYEYISIQWNSKGLNDKFEKPFNRSTAKLKILALFNTPAKLVSKSKHWKEFTKLFPNVAERIKNINGDFPMNKKIFSDEDIKCPIAYITQYMESDLILNHVCKNIKTKNPEIPLLTIHDAIYTIEQFTTIVEAELLLVYQDIIGMQPNINIKFKGVKENRVLAA